MTFEAPLEARIAAALKMPLSSTNGVQVDELYDSFKALAKERKVATPTLDALVSMAQLRGSTANSRKRKAEAGSEDEVARTMKKHLTTAQDVKRKCPMSPAASNTVSSGRSAIEAVLDNTDDRVVVIVGPCSIHDPAAAMEYCTKLVQLAQHHSKELVTVMRVYFEKPRTTVGWKGLINDPDLDGSCDIEKGLVEARKLLVAVNEAGVPAATEFLDLVRPRWPSHTLTVHARCPPTTSPT